MNESDSYNKNSNEENKVEIQLDPEALKGAYSNIANIVHSKEEFILDFLFIQRHPAPFGKLVSRIITSPLHAKRLANALNENIRKYEQKYGFLDISENPEHNEDIQ